MNLITPSICYLQLMQETAGRAKLSNNVSILVPGAGKVKLK